MNIVAKPILIQTKGKESIVINFPKIAVKPQINTIKCKCSKLRILYYGILK